MIIKIKPISVNQCWQGRRFKTKLYKSFEIELLSKLKPLEVPAGKLQIFIKFGLSSKNADWDNPIKPFVDILQKKYGFNDNRIKRAIVDVVRTKKGEEYIDFEIRALNECPDNIKRHSSV